MPKPAHIGPTKVRILTQLRQGSRTARQIASLLRMQVSAARKHLDRLSEWGFVTTEFRREGTGRPKKLYLLTDEGTEWFPRHYEVVLNDLLAELVKDRGVEYAQKLLVQIAEQHVPSIARDRGTDQNDLRPLVATLAELGFEPKLQVRNGLATITSHNCPILRTAKVHKELVCESLHAEIIQQATSAAVLRDKWIVHGDPVCTHQFRTVSE